MRMYCNLAVIMAKKDPGLSQAALCRELSLAPATVSRLFNNEFERFDRKTIEKICTYFDCKFGDLFIEVEE